MRLRTILRNGISLGQFRPHPRLVNYWSSSGTMSTREVVGPSNDFFSREVQKAAEQAPRSDRVFRTLIVGPGNFSNLPLEYLLARGQVVGVDVGLKTMQEARSCLSARERANLACVQADASLFASPMIDFLEKNIAQGRPDHNLFMDLYTCGNSAADLLPRQKYPFRDEGFDLIICISTLAQLTMTFAGIVQELLEGKFGQNEVETFFAAKAADDACREDYIGSVYSAIFNAVFVSQFREFARMLKVNGALFVSDHFLRGECKRFEDSRGRVLFASLSPNSYYQSGGEIKFLDMQGVSQEGLEISLRERDPRMKGFGDDMLSLRAAAAGLEVLDNFWFWNITDHFEEKGIYEVSFDEAVLATKRAGASDPLISSIT